MATSVISSFLASKFKGCMIGVLLGDCLGRPFEGDWVVSKSVLCKFFTNLLSGDSIQILPYSDDTSMTLSVAASLLEKGKVDAKDMAKRFVAEFYSQPKRGYGMNVEKVFHSLRESNFEDVFLPAKLQFDGSGSYGNGAAMRVSPIALFGYDKGEEYIMNAAEECSRITHAHIHGYNGAILQSLAVYSALKLDPAQDFNPVCYIDGLYKRMENIETKQGDKPFCDSLKKIRSFYTENREPSFREIVEDLGNTVTAHRSVPTAIYSFLRGMKPLKDFEHSNPFVRTLYFAISNSGDTDTIASMAGSIAGAYYGIDFVPDTLQKRCELIEEVRNYADKLYDAVTKKEQ